MPAIRMSWPVPPSTSPIATAAAFQLSVPDVSEPAAGNFVAVTSTSAPEELPKRTRVSSVRVPVYVPCAPAVAQHGHH